MTGEASERKRALNDLFDQAFDEVDPSEDSPLYTQLQSIDKRYEDLELIAVGGMKRIFKALDRKGNRHVALARLHEDASDLLFDPFIREAQLTALLDHPNVISVHDIGIDSAGQPYFTMDLKVGDGLDVVLKKAKNDKRPLADRLEIFIKVCDAITYAHSRNVIHLDLKPANIQVGSFGEVLVCDWGLAKLIGGTEIIYDEELLNPDLLNEMTIYGTVKGTPGYMAPEQILNEERDHRTDIYALGALLYATLTCHHPVEGDTQTMLMSALAGDIIPPTERDKTIPNSLSAVVMKAMSLHPDDRYQSVSALISEVRAFLSGYSPVAHKSNAWTEFRLYYQRNRNSCNVAAVFLAIVVLGTAIFVDRLNAKKSEAEALAERLKIEKQETELLAERLQKEKQESESLAERLQIEKKQTETLLNEAVEEASSIFFEAPLESYRLSMRSLNDAISNQPEKAELNGRKLGYLYFMSTDYTKANSYFTGSYTNGLIRLSREVAKTFDPEKHKESAEQIAEVIKALKGFNRTEMAHRVLAYDFAALGYRDAYDKAVMAVIGPKTQSTYDLNLKAGKLTVNGHPKMTKILSHTNLNIWSFLPIRHVVLKNTGIEDDSSLAELGILETADLRGSKISSVANMSKLPQLRSIIVLPGQISPEEKKLIPPKIRLHERR